jgi:NAD(P)-dependent dehydrogenase (short-subunit alcohol dehydrogenase family)/acyl carrier protein
VIPKEFPNIKCFNVDLPSDEASDEVITRIVSEFDEPTNNSVIAYRGRYRWERDFRPVNLPKDQSRRLKHRGVYVITGGTGGIGLCISKYLAQACQPRIVLTKRSAFPEKSQWKQLLTTRDASESDLKTVSALLEIEAMGAEIDVQVAEVSDRAQMQKVLDDTLQRHGTINGIIHAAGIVRTGLIQGKTQATVTSVLAPKVDGTLILFDLIKDLPLDFVVLFSSMTSIESPYAQFDYSAANAFLDAFTYAANTQYPFHTLTINWPGWKEVGLLANLEMPLGMEGWKEDALKKSIAPADGVEAFARALNSGLKQVIVSPEELDEVVNRSRLPVDPTMYLSRPALTPAVRGQRIDNPTNEVETAVAEIWREVFGIDHIGIHENFSQLGGHSLLAMQIVAKIRSLYEIRFTLREFFDAPTIAQMSSFIQARVLADIESLTDEQARGLVSA